MRAAASLVTTGGVAAAAWSVPSLMPHCPPLARALGVATRLASDAVALTFDDGPHPEGTVAVMEVLARERVKATFFLVGEQIRRSPALAREVLAEGHAVGIHGDRHRNLLALTPARIAEDFDRVLDTFGEHLGVAPGIHRPPYGVYSFTALAQVRRRGWQPTLWSRWGRDWTSGATPMAIASRVADGVRGGDILLLHDADTYSAPQSHQRTAAALTRVLDALAGIELVTLGPRCEL
jgi:peptidoglycan/xylan/chitin deacetylase (PgdA/CDA1 family)